MLSNRVGSGQQMLTPKHNPEFDNRNTRLETDDRDVVDFDKLYSQSAMEKRVEAEKAAQDPNAKNIQLGETKDDAEFRDMLEKVTGKKQTKLKNKMEKDDYLTLMVTQLKHQDPLKPMDNEQMATQLASFNTVEQLMAANKTLNGMSESKEADRADKLAQFLGRTIEGSGGKIKLNTDMTVTQARFELPDDTGSTSLTIKDKSGAAIRTIPLGTMNQGSHDVTWDGKTDKGIAAPVGNYTYSVSASGKDGKEVKPVLNFVARVNGIRDFATGGKLDTDLGVIEMSEIKSIRHDAAPAPVQAAPQQGPSAAAPAAAPTEQIIGGNQQPAAPAAQVSGATANENPAQDASGKLAKKAEQLAEEAPKKKDAAKQSSKAKAQKSAAALYNNTPKQA